MGAKIESSVAISKHYSIGLFRRIYNVIEAPFRQGDVNHITGDVHYISLLLRKRKTILTILDCGFMSNQVGLKAAVLKLFWLTLPVKRAQVITAISEFTKQDILRFVDCDPEKIRVVPVAINQRFQKVPKEFNESCPTLLQVGSAPNKNLTRIIEAVGGLNIQLHIIGKITPENLLLLEANKIKYKNCFSISDDELLQSYIDCDILLFPSTFEGFGMPILEAQAIGRPVITSNNSSMPEVAGDSAILVDAFLVDEIRKAVLNITTNRELREELVQKGFENIKRYDPDLIANQYCALYEEIAAGK